MNPLRSAGHQGNVISGSAEEIADAMRSFREAGFSQVDLMIGPGTIEAFEAMAPVLALLRRD